MKATVITHSLFIFTVQNGNFCLGLKFVETAYKKRNYGPWLVGIGSLIWATDALVRVPTAHKVSANFVVLVEHLIGVLFLLPFVFKYEGRNTFKLASLKDWLACLIVGAGGSALALVFFTLSFAYINPSINILIQKLQPIFVVTLAVTFLSEKPKSGFYAWASLALCAAVGLNYNELFTNNSSEQQAFHLKGILFSLLSTFIWAVSTIAGKRLLNTVSSLKATFLRFFFGLLTLLIITFATEENAAWNILLEPSYLPSFLFLGLVPGILAMWVYYQGMKTTSALATTIIELLFPIGAIILNYFYLNASLDYIQLFSSLVLIFAVTKISLNEAS